MLHIRLIMACAPLALGGCVAKTAFDVVTAPVRVAGKAVDLATTSQSEADEKRGRALRKHEEEIGSLQRRYENQMDQCNDGRRRACSEAQTTYGELQTLLRDSPER